MLPRLPLDRARRRFPVAVSLAGLLAPLLLGLAPAAYAGDLLISPSPYRFLQVYGESYCPGCGPDGEDEYYSDSDSDRSYDAGIWDRNLNAVGNGASIESEISADRIDGSVDFSLGYTAFAEGTFEVDVTFQVSEAGKLAVEVDATEATFSLSDPVGPLVEATFDYYSGEIEVEPGVDYRIESDGYVYVSGETLTFSVVPEPDALLLLAAGVLALAVRRWWRG